MAKVIAVGPGKVEEGILNDIGVKVNDTVIYKSYSTTEVKYDHKTYLLIDAKDILAIIE